MAPEVNLRFTEWQRQVYRDGTVYTQATVIHNSGEENIAKVENETGQSMMAGTLLQAKGQCQPPKQSQVNFTVF